jgi:DNA polymerase delta subunit 1
MITTLNILVVDAETCQVSLDPKCVALLRRNGLQWTDASKTWKEHERRERVPGACYLVRIWGRTADGRSVCVVVPDACSTSYRRLLLEHRSVAQLTSLARLVAQALEPSGLGPSAAKVSLVWRHTTNGWHEDPRDPCLPAMLPWLQISVASTCLKTAASRACQKAGTELNCLSAISPITGERNVEVHTEVLLAAGVRPGAWLCVTGHFAEASSRICADLTVQVLASELKVSSLGNLGPLRVLSFDIECYSESGDFPDASKPEDCIITIGCYSKTLFVEEPKVRALALCLGQTNPGDDGETRCFETEAELLLAFGEAMRVSDADIVVGYNTSLFDWRYISGRVDTLQKQGKLSKGMAAEIFCNSRVRCLSTAPQDSMVASSALGDNPLHIPRMPGRFEVDLWFYLKRENSTALPDLKLNTVSKHYLAGDCKHDLPPQQIFERFRSGGAEGRAEVACYCLQDCKLVLDLVEKLAVVQGVMQMASVTWVTPHDINFRGQQIKVYTQLLRKARDLNYVLEDTISSTGPEDEEYQGAHVVPPIVGYYTDPVLTLDFASLYPSLMRSYNLSPDTLVLSPSGKTPMNLIPNTEHRFISSTVQRGLLPLILDELLAERKRVRREMSSCSDPLQRSLLDCRQLALKISANSCYGFTGSRRGMMTCLEVAESTTGAGRHAIHMTTEAIEREWPGSSVIYGDTDSCFVRLPLEQRQIDGAAVFQLGEQMAALVTALFASSMLETSYVELEMEKYFNPLVLYKKKRYAGLCFEEPGKPGKMCAKGIEMVRRDASALLRRTQRQVLDAFVFASDAKAAVAATIAAVEAILAVAPGGPFVDLTESKNLRAKYVNPGSMSHVKVAELMNQRSPGSGPRIGERVHYMVIASETPRIVDKVEDVTYAEQQKLPPDWLHYVEKVELPLMRLLRVPLEFLGPEKIQEVVSFFAEAKLRAHAQVRMVSLARRGTEWLSGHVTAGGGTQLKLALKGMECLPLAAAPKKRAKKIIDESTPQTLHSWFKKA